MAPVRIHEDDPVHWRQISDWTPDAIKVQISDLELASSIRVHEPGSENSLQLFEVQFLPHTLVDIHAHDEEEIMYVVAGEMLVGKRALRPGASIYVAGSTLYSFRAGPDGLRVLNFRPRIDSTYHSRDAVMKAHREAQPA